MRRKSYYSSYYRSPQWQWWKALLMFLGGTICLFLLTEVVLRLFAGSAFVVAPTLRDRYQLSLSTSQGEVLRDSPPHGLKIKLSPVLSYTMVPNQKSEYWQINGQGFRDEEALPFAKPPQEVRIFVIGGSTAFGQFAPNNGATIANLLEKKLQERVALQRSQPEKFQPTVLPFFFEQVEAALSLPPLIKPIQYRVINAAVPGYTSREELSLLTHTILQLQPDYIILLDGYADLLKNSSPWESLDHWLQQPGKHYRAILGDRLRRFWQNLYVVRAWRKLQPPPSPYTNRYRLSTDPTDRVQQYRYNLKLMAKLLEGKPFLLLIQPEITSKATPTEAEKKILATLGEDYRTQIRQTLATLTPAKIKQEAPKATVFNFYSLFAQFTKQAFVDPIHLTVEGTEFLVDRIFQEVIKSFLITPALPPSEETSG